MTTSTPVPEAPLGKWKASTLLVKESWNLLKQDREILFFPILASVCNAFVFVAFIAAIFFTNIVQSVSQAVDQGKDPPTLIIYGILFLFYFASFFIMTFFQIGLTAIVDARLNGKNYSFADGMHVATSKISKIFVWSLLAATVGVLLKYIADRSSFLGKIVISILGASWSLLTFFIVPVIALQDTGIQDSVKTSGTIFKKTWGETFIGGFSMDLFFGLTSILILLVVGLLTVFLGSEFDTTYAIIFALVSVVVVLLAVSLCASTLKSVFNVVLYHYATTGNIPSSFTPALVKGALKKK